MPLKEAGFREHRSNVRALGINEKVKALMRLQIR